MDLFNTIICSFFDLVCLPFADLHPLWGLTTLSVLTGIIMLLVFRVTSDQAAIRNVKKRIKAHFLEIRLFKDDLGLMLEAQKNVLKHNLTYMRHSLKPMLFLLVPVVLIMIHLSLWFDSSPLKKGETAIVKLKFREEAPFNADVSLRVPEGVLLETPPVRIQAEREICWRIKALEKGTYQLEVMLNPGKVTKALVVSDQLARLSAKRVSKNIFQRALYPGEKSLPKNTGIEFIEIKYPSISYHVFGWNIHWLVIFFVVSIAAGFLLKRLFNVEI